VLRNRKRHFYKLLIGFIVLIILMLSDFLVEFDKKPAISEESFLLRF